MLSVLEELVRGTTEEASRKLASVSYAAQGLRKMGLDLSSIGSNIQRGLASAGNNVKDGLLSGNPLYTGAAGALLGGGLGVANELQRPKEERDYTSAAMNAGIGGLVGGLGGVAMQGMQSKGIPQAPPPKGTSASAMKEGLNTAATQTKAVAHDLGTAAYNTLTKAEKPLGNVGQGALDTISDLPGTSVGTATGALWGGAVAASRRRPGGGYATTGNLAHAIDAAGSPSLGVNAPGILSNVDAMSALRTANNSGGFPGVRAFNLNRAMSRGVAGASADDVRQLARSMGGKLRTGGGGMRAAIPALAGAAYDVYNAKPSYNGPVPEPVEIPAGTIDPKSVKW
jgi:hypothetical protein